MHIFYFFDVSNPLSLTSYIKNVNPQSFMILKQLSKKNCHQIYIYIQMALIFGGSLEQSRILRNTCILSLIITQIQQMALPFALIIPGQPLLTTFECTNGIYHVDFPDPKTIANVSIFLTEPIPENYAISLYFSLPPYNQMQYLGAIANARPSDTFSTGFPFRPQFEKINTVKFCIQAQTFEQVANLVRCSDGQKQYSKLVAHNLYNFMMSFHNQNMLLKNYQQGREYLVVPTDTFTRWMKKFDQKYQKDPNFILKTTIE